MNSINISKRKFESLKELELPKEVISTEAFFYKFNYLGKTKVFKSLHKTSGPLFANKLFTIEMLNEYREILPSNFVIPESLVSVDKKLKGFDLPYIKGINLEAYLKSSEYSAEDKLFYIKKIGELLNKLSHIRKESNLKCIYLNDLHASNFIVDPKTKELNVVDLDSSRICDSKPFPARYLTPFSLLNKSPNKNKYDIFQKESTSNYDMPSGILTHDEKEEYYLKYKNYREELGFVNSNEDSDLYCYVILFLNYLYGANVGSFTLEEFYNYIEYLADLGFNKRFIKAIVKIVSGAHNENIEPYIDSVTADQVMMANRKIYRLKK